MNTDQYRDIRIDVVMLQLPKANYIPIGIGLVQKKSKTRNYVATLLFVFFNVVNDITLKQAPLQATTKKYT